MRIKNLANLKYPDTVAKPQRGTMLVEINNFFIPQSPTAGGVKDCHIAEKRFKKYIVSPLRGYLTNGIFLLLLTFRPYRAYPRGYVTND